MENQIIDIQICNDPECSHEGDFPTATEMAKNFFTDARKAFSGVMKTGQLMATEEERDKRWTLCQACPFLENGRCKKCGCFMKAKTTLQTAKCPIGKW